MSNFEPAVKVVLRLEGGFVNNKFDPGGATNYGISLRYLKGLGDSNADGFLDGDFNHDGIVDAKDIKDMSEEQASDVYNKIWCKQQYWRINDQQIATFLFSIAVNIGVRQANIIMQRAVRAASSIVLERDGVLGDKSYEAINKCYPPMLLACLKMGVDCYYNSLREDLKKEFLAGWLNRTYSVM